MGHDFFLSVKKGSSFSDTVLGWGKSTVKVGRPTFSAFFCHTVLRTRCRTFWWFLLTVCLLDEHDTIWSYYYLNVLCSVCFCLYYRSVNCIDDRQCFVGNLTEIMGFITVFNFRCHPTRRILIIFL
jgi:hypothetical protein